MRTVMTEFSMQEVERCSSLASDRRGAGGAGSQTSARLSTASGHGRYSAGKRQDGRLIKRHVHKERVRARGYARLTNQDGVPGMAETTTSRSKASSGSSRTSLRPSRSGSLRKMRDGQDKSETASGQGGRSWRILSCERMRHLLLRPGSAGGGVDVVPDVGEGVGGVGAQGADGSDADHDN